MKTSPAVFVVYLLHLAAGNEVNSISTEYTLQNITSTEAPLQIITSTEAALQNITSTEAALQNSASTEDILQKITTEALLQNITSTEDTLENITNTEALLQNINSTEAALQNRFSTKDTLQLISRRANDFSLKMYNVLRKTEGNLFFSPPSLAVLLAMVYLGSKGNVSDEIKTALNLPDNDDILKEGFKEFINIAEKSEPLEIATRMFASVDFQIKEKFLSDAANYFYSGVENVDYIRKPQEAVKIINSYVAEKTHNKIKDLIKEVSPDTALILVNALYFKADWVHPFSVTRPSPFYISQNKSVIIDMMSMSKDLCYKHHNELKAQILELPYKGDEYSMFIFLPDDVEGSQNVEEKLVNLNIEDVISDCYTTTVNVKIPKFKLEKQIELNNVLEEMGMESMFVPGAADLSGIADGNMYISKAVQKTFIKVDEKGTEAAAATELLFTKYSLSAHEQWFIANHPFIFTVIRKADNSVLFMGRFASV